MITAVPEFIRIAMKAKPLPIIALAQKFQLGMGAMKIEFPFHNHERTAA